MLTLESLDWKLIHNVTKNTFDKNNAFEVALRRRLWSDASNQIHSSKNNAYKLWLRRDSWVDW
jgi:hypothetical protein